MSLRPKAMMTVIAMTAVLGLVISSILVKRTGPDDARLHGIIIEKIIQPQPDGEANGNSGMDQQYILKVHVAGIDHTYEVSADIGTFKTHHVGDLYPLPPVPAEGATAKEGDRHDRSLR